MSHLGPSLLQLSLKLRVQLMLLMHLLLQHHGIHRGPVHVSHAHALAAAPRCIQVPWHRILFLQVPPLVLQTAACKHSAVSQPAVAQYPCRLFSSCPADQAVQVLSPHMRPAQHMPMGWQGCRMQSLCHYCTQAGILDRGAQRSLPP